MTDKHVSQDNRALILVDTVLETTVEPEMNLSGGRLKNEASASNPLSSDETDVGLQIDTCLEVMCG